MPIAYPPTTIKLKFLTYFNYVQHFYVLLYNFYYINEKIIFKKWGENIGIEKIFGGEMSNYAKNNQGGNCPVIVLSLTDILQQQISY